MLTELLVDTRYALYRNKMENTQAHIYKLKDTK